MNRSRALELLTQSKPTLATRYGVTEKALRAELRPFIERKPWMSGTTQRERKSCGMQEAS